MNLIGYNTEDVQAPTDSALGLHIIDSLMDSEFDVGTSKFLDPTRGRGERGGIGHAFGYVYNRLMTEGVIPTVPVMLNHLLPAQPADAKAVLQPGAGAALRHRVVDTGHPGGHPGFRRPEPLRGGRGAGPAGIGRNAGQERRQVDGPAAREDQLREFPRSATGSSSPAPPNTWTWTWWTTCRATARRRARAAPWGLPLGGRPLSSEAGFAGLLGMLRIIRLSCQSLKSRKSCF